MKINFSLKDFPIISSYKNGDYILYFTENELLHAAYTVGKDSWEKVTRYPYYSDQEMQFRLHMIRAFIKMDSEWVERTELFMNLDPSEKSSINYFLGMVFSNLIMRKEFQLLWMLHLDLFEGHITYKDPKKKKKPDFISKKINLEWSVIESKGRIENNKKTVDNAKEQLESLKEIDGKLPTEKMISVFYGNRTNLHIDVIDPEDYGEVKVSTTKVDYARSYYAQVFNFLKDSHEIKVINNTKFVVRDFHCTRFTVGLFEDIFTIMSNSKSINTTEEIEELLIKNSDIEHINTKYYIGNDGIYISSFKEIEKERRML